MTSDKEWVPKSTVTFSSRTLGGNVLLALPSAGWFFWLYNCFYDKIVILAWLIHSALHIPVFDVETFDEDEAATSSSDEAYFFSSLDLCQS